jgi:hypothetical protein
VASEFQKPRTNRALDSEPAGVQFFFPSAAKAGSIKMPMHVPDDPAKKNVPTATKSRHGQKTNMYEVLQPKPQPLVSGDTEMEQLNDPDIGPILQGVKPGSGQKGKTSQNAAPHTKSTGLSGNRSL